MTDSSDIIISAQNISRSIQGSTILQNISISLQKGSINLLIGPSGGGKSTLLRLLNRLETATTGSLHFDDKPIDQYKPTELRSRVALNLQEPSFFTGTLRHNLELPRTLHLGRFESAPDTNISKLLEICCLSENLLERQPTELSVGQRQRASIARALMLEPQVLLLDEPTAPLDIVVAEKLRANLYQYCKETDTTLLIASHDLNMANGSDILFFLVEGVIVEQGTPDVILNRPESTKLQAFLERRAE